MKNLKIFLQVDNSTICEFSGNMNEKMMVKWASKIEKLLLDSNATRDKIQNVFELFVETVQNILSYSYNNINSHDTKLETLCDFSLLYFTDSDTYILESCNLIEENQESIIKKKIKSLENLKDKDLRKMIRQKSRSKEDSHKKGAGLGFIIMARKSSQPIEAKFIPYKDGVLKYKQKLFI